jgi:hypothetical protein
MTTRRQIKHAEEKKAKNLTIVLKRRTGRRVTCSGSRFYNGSQAMKSFVILFLSTLAFAQEPSVRKEPWGMTQNEVIAAEKATPLKRNGHSLVYRGKELGIPSQVIFEFTNGKLDAFSYVSDSPSQNPESAFLTWCLALTKRYGHGEVYLNKEPAGRPGLVLDESLKEFWKQSDGEILVVFPPEGSTYAGVGITLTNGNPTVDMDFAVSPRSAGTTPP